MLGLVPALGLLSDCNLILGAGRYKVGSGCADCVQARCAAESAACDANPGCSALFACMANCGPNDSTCRLGCKRAHPAKDEATIALTVCRGAGCRDECVACGDAVDNGAACDACMRASCCSELTACTRDAACERGGVKWTCFDPNCASVAAEDPATLAWSSSPLADGVFRCALASCSTDCALGDLPWDCVGDFLYTFNPAQSVIVTMPVTEFGASRGLDGVRVRACSAIDAACTKPVSVAAALTSGGGPKQPSTTTLTVPEGFSGYFELIREHVDGQDDFAPTLFFPGYPVIGTVNFCGGRLCERLGTPAMPMINLSQAASLGALLGLTEAGGGYMVVRAVDCRNSGGSDVVFGLDNPGKSKTFYFAHNVPTTAATETDLTGLGGFAGVSPGFVTFSAKLKLGGKLVSQYRLPVRADALTVLFAYPLTSL